jgi:phosphoglycolate phosphatase-like HAD superfamily hydrolase
MRKLLLWDIDGTLISTNRAGTLAILRALRETCGIEIKLDGRDLAGRTDPIIWRTVCQRYGIEDSPERRHEFYERYLEYLRAELLARGGRPHPGILEILEAVRLRSDLAQGLLTGNQRRGAEIKLTHFRLWHYFEFGAFGPDGETRNHLGPHALREAYAKLGVEFRPEDTFVIGDTPHDIECGKVFGARTIAVATSGFSIEELASHQPDAVFPDLSDQAAFFQVIDGPPAS